MTVSKLIELLEAWPPDAEVYIRYWNRWEDDYDHETPTLTGDAEEVIIHW